MVIVLKPAGAPITCGTAKVPIVRTKMSTAAVAIAGPSSGNVIVRSTVTGRAPDARPARSVAGSARVLSPTTVTR